MLPVTPMQWAKPFPREGRYVVIVGDRPGGDALLLCGASDDLSVAAAGFGEACASAGRSEQECVQLIDQLAVDGPAVLGCMHAAGRAPYQLPAGQVLARDPGLALAQLRRSGP
jgi:hypothetical protein